MPWASTTDPNDVAGRHVEQIGDSRHEYVITQGGTMDGTNCRSPVGVYEGWRQVWESNRIVRMENVGETDLVNPWLSNGRNNFRTIEEIVASAVEPDMSDAEKATALWHQETTYRYHWTCGDRDVKTPVKVLNIYGYNTCGDDSNCLAGLWRTAGLKVRPARIETHCISQVFYDDGWHLMDGDQHSVYLLRDNKTIASERALVRDHDLIKRSHTHGILLVDNRAKDEEEAAMYVYEGDTPATRDSIGTHTMNMVLRPGEALIWRWGHTDPLRCHGNDEARVPDTISNGLWEYRPDFSGELWRKGADTVEGVTNTKDGLAPEADRMGTIIWRMCSPYVFVGGTLEAECDGVRFELSWDGLRWQELDGNPDEMFPPDGPPRYQYYIRCLLDEGARLRSLAIINDVQMAPLALPGMVVGENSFVYTDESTGKCSVRITHEWVERSTSKPPTAPSAPVFPSDGGETDGTDVVFKWTAPRNPDGEEIADYHFELSDRPDMRWPLSTNFAKIISNTADRGKTQYTLPYPGLLTPDRKYCWHVRAKNDNGVWGYWSKTWSFTARGVAYPIEVKLSFDKERGIGTLHWKPNPVGCRPAKYRVYGSDEKGFSVSDEPYKANVGGQENRKLPLPFPANFVTETDGIELVVVSVGLELPNANRAYYRVVAVDEGGKRSWSSDYAAAPRPFIYSKPVADAKVGREYRYRVCTIRSIGDLRIRTSTRMPMTFWDVEEPTFSLEQGPEWLRIDPATGELSGTPDAPGKAEVVVIATIEVEVRKLDERILTWGREKVLEVTTEKVGSATQQFVLVSLPKSRKGEGGLS